MPVVKARIWKASDIDCLFFPEQLRSLDSLTDLFSILDEFNEPLVITKLVGEEADLEIIIYDDFIE